VYLLITKESQLNRWEMPEMAAKDRWLIFDNKVNGEGSFAGRPCQEWKQGVTNVVGMLLLLS
jgi:hypothetical protein